MNQIDTGINPNYQIRFFSRSSLAGELMQSYANTEITAIYYRLSRDDGTETEGN